MGEAFTSKRNDTRYPSSGGEFMKSWEHDTNKGSNSFLRNPKKQSRRGWKTSIIALPYLSTKSFVSLPFKSQKPELVEQIICVCWVTHQMLFSSGSSPPLLCHVLWGAESCCQLSSLSILFHLLSLSQRKGGLSVLTVHVVVTPNVHELICWQLLQLSRVGITVLTHEVLGLLDAHTFHCCWRHAQGFDILLSGEKFLLLKCSAGEQVAFMSLASGGGR